MKTGKLEDIVIKKYLNNDNYVVRIEKENQKKDNKNFTRKIS